jgi:protein-L-isoaspartate(D-aspartate) O-methyltransferase
MDEHAAERERMVAQQLEPRRITDARVLAAMREVPRHLFVPERDRRSAYGDHALPIGHGQTISQPYMVAVMCQELTVQPGDKVLEIGAGSGYQAAVLSRLAETVITVERIPALAKQAEKTLEAAGYRNVQVVVGDGTAGFPERAPYERIIVAAGAPEVPEPLLEQLAEGGRLVAPVGGRGYQQLIIADKVGGEVAEQHGCQCVFVPLIGQHGWDDAW